MVLAGRPDKFPEPISVWRCAHRNAMGPYRGTLRHKVSKRDEDAWNIDNILFVGELIGKLKKISKSTGFQHR